MSPGVLMLPRCHPPCPPTFTRGCRTALLPQPSLLRDGFPIPHVPFSAHPSQGALPRPCPGCSRLPRGHTEPRRASQGSSHAAGKPRAHTAPDLATDTLLKIAGSWEAAELHLLPQGADSELQPSSRGAGRDGDGMDGWRWDGWMELE